MNWHERAAVAAPGVASILLAAAILMPSFDVSLGRIDVIAVIDITQSMNVRDTAVDGLPVSRREFAKQALVRAVSSLPCGSRIGLGVFTDYRVYVLFKPLETCANRQEIEDSIAHINERMSWARSSQIAKALHISLRTLAQLESPPALAFITDGHEAPPVNLQYPVDLGGEAGRVHGVIAGVGGSRALPIPKHDPDGRPIGVWQADEVAQVDPYSRGRQGSAANEAMADAGSAAAVPEALRVTPGSEHLSSLHEPYLRWLAAEAHFTYGRLTTVDDLSGLLQSSLAVRQPVPTDVRWVAALLALAALLVPHCSRTERG